MKRSPPVRPVHATPRVDRRSGRLEVWGGVECSVVRVGDVYRSSMQRSGHDRRASDIARIADLGVTALRMPVLWELVAPDGIERADWRWPDERLALAREHGVRPIVGLVHHGSGTRTTSLLDEAFPERLAEYAAAVARRYPWVTDFTPVNEPLTTARFSALYGHWYPHARSAAAFAGALVNECRATVLAMEAIRAITPAARLIQTEDYGHVRSTPRLAYQAEHENQRRWLSLDLLCGRVDEAHPLHGYLRHVGIRHRELAFFLAHRTAPEVIGLNYYLTSERFLDENVEAYPAGLHGGNDIDRYADVEAVRLGVPLAGHAGAISETWTRYRLPLAITEVHLGCTREEQLRWWRQAWRAASRAREFGIDVRAVCAWALFGSHDWGSLLLVDRGDYEVGAFDVRSHPPRPTAIARGIAQVAREGRLDHPVLDVPGWWRRPSRVFYGPGAGTPDPADARARPILIIGATGTLGHALCAACTARGLAFRPLTRAALDVGDPGAVARALDVHRPWAIVNAAGYVRVDDAEDHLEECWRVNVEGARLLAEACAARGVKLVAISSDLVFDGRSARPYIEDDTPSPLNVYGASKAESERVTLNALTEALVVRTSAFFGPWDGSNFVRRAVTALADHQPFRAAEDVVVSPTYVPDLAAWVLDLLIDGERGIWHVANDGALSWWELAWRAARVYGVSTASLVRCEAASLGLRAVRPRYSALGSARGARLRDVDAALRACADGRRA